MYKYGFTCGHIQTQEPRRNPITLLSPPWLICVLWNIVKYQAYFMIQPSAGAPFFFQHLGLFVKLSQTERKALPNLAQYFNILDI